MSRKLTAFKSATILPQVTCNYQIIIPSISRSIMAVEAASLPFKKVVSQSIYIRGVQYQIPVKKTAQGTWSCTMSENMFMSAMYQSLCSMNQMQGGEYTFGLNRIYIYITDVLTGASPVATCILDGCYLTDIKEISLSASGATDVMKVQLTFQYNDILDPIKNSGVADVFDSFDSAIAEDNPFAHEVEAGTITALAWGLNKVASEIDKRTTNIRELLGL